MMKRISYPKILVAITLMVFACGCGASDSDDGTDSRSCTSLSDSGDVDGNVTLTDDDCYMIDDTVALTHGELTVEPGTQVYFGPDAGLVVEQTGRLNVAGTTDNPVLFRGDHDEHGFWRGIKIAAGGTHHIEHAHIQHGGSAPWDHDNYHARGGVVVDDDSAQLTVGDVEFTDNETAAVTTVAEGAELDIAHSSFADNDTPLRLHPDQVGGLGEGLEFGDHRTEAVVIHTDGTAADNAHWPKLELPYLVEEPIELSATISVDSGTEFRFDRHAGIDVNAGVFEAVGTGDDPVRFVGDNDVSGFWRGLRFRNAPGEASRLEHVEILHGGSEHWDRSWSNSAANLLVHDGGHVTLNHAYIAHSDYHGISIRDALVDGCNDIEYEDHHRHSHHTYDDDEGCR